MNTSEKYADLLPADIKTLSDVGISIENSSRAGTYILKDYQHLLTPTMTEGLEVLPISTALEKYDWLREKYYFNLIKADQDEVTKYCAEQEVPFGYYIHVDKGVKITNAYQAGFFMTCSQMAQAVHNIVVVEEDAKLNLITGCGIASGIGSVKHYAISEHYIGKNARFTNTMVHSWGEKVKVRPRAGTSVDENGIFTSNYICMRPAQDMESKPMTWLKWKECKREIP